MVNHACVRAYACACVLVVCMCVWCVCVCAESTDVVKGVRTCAHQPLTTLFGIFHSLSSSYAWCLYVRTCELHCLSLLLMTNCLVTLHLWSPST